MHHAFLRDIFFQNLLNRGTAGPQVLETTKSMFIMYNSVLEGSTVEENRYEKRQRF